MKPENPEWYKKREAKKKPQVSKDLTLEEFYEKFKDNSGFGATEITKNIKRIKAEQGKLEKAIKPKEKRRIATGIIGGVVSVGLVVGTVASGGLLAVGIAAGCAIAATTGAYAAAARSEISARAKLAIAMGDNNNKLNEYNQILRNGPSQSAASNDMLFAYFKCYKENCVRDRIQEETRKQTRVIKSRKRSRVGTGALVALGVTGLTVASIVTGGAVAVLAAAVGIGVVGTAAYAGAAKREITGYKKLSDSMKQQKQELLEVKANIEAEIKTFRETHGLDTTLPDGLTKKSRAGGGYDDDAALAKSKAKYDPASREARKAQRAMATERYSNSSSSLESKGGLPRRRSGDEEADYAMDERPKVSPISPQDIGNGYIEISVKEGPEGFDSEGESFESLPAGPEGQGYEEPEGFDSEGESFESLPAGPEDDEFAGLNLCIFETADSALDAQNTPEGAGIISSGKKYTTGYDARTTSATDRPDNPVKPGQEAEKHQKPEKPKM